LASAVFEGTVSAILNIPGQGQAVLVNHGDFFTVYSHLSVVLVEKGQVIRMNQHIGKVMTDEDGKAVLQFQVWHGQEKQNPQSWLRGR
jgi:murein DD-endopeptidase MepM/ murein hydrolase activator NlpD